MTILVRSRTAFVSASFSDSRSEFIRTIPIPPISPLAPMVAPGGTLRLSRDVTATRIRRPTTSQSMVGQFIWPFHRERTRRWWWDCEAVTLVSNLQPASLWNSRERAEYTFDYFNPNVSLEFYHFGIGMGYVSKRVPIHFSDHIETAANFSGHARWTIYHGSYLLISYNENVPLVSGGGSFNLGFGIPAGGVSLFIGLSAGQYHNLGLVHQGENPTFERLSRRCLASLGMKREVVFEGGGAVGLVYQFGKTPALNYGYRIPSCFIRYTSICLGTCSNSAAFDLLQWHFSNASRIARRCVS